MGNSEYDKQWEFVLTHPDENVRRIAERASREPALRRLFPYASLSNLRFSRTDAYPYDPLPYVLTVQDGHYEARAANNQPLGEGDLEAVIPVVVRAIAVL
jgi:hypothetical protein